MKVIKSAVIAFSMYSKIPMPQFKWQEEDMNYMLCFFPWVGAVIGFLVYVWCLFCERFLVGELCRIFVGAAIPLLLTGGFHADGFLDTADALCSYQPKEKKLKILEDSHIGAFSVISFAVYGLIYIGAFSEIGKREILKTVCAGFVLARCLSGIGVLSLSPAKKEGLLVLSAKSAKKRIVKPALYVQGVLCIIFMLHCSLSAGTAVSAAAGIIFFQYAIRCRKELGGVTGDTAGCFVLLCEAGMMAAAAAVDILMRIR